jgi:uncharacterized protein
MMAPSSHSSAAAGKVTEPVILIRINRLYRPGMTADELYDATCSSWKVGTRREGAEYALAICKGVVREVYSIEAWHPGGTTPRKTEVHTNPRHAGRWEFTGSVARDPIRSKYIGRSLAEYFPRGSANPVVYVNVQP